MPIAHKIISKKKNISDTTLLPKLNLTIIIICFGALAIISLYPILNLSLTVNLINESTHNIKEYTTILYTRAYIGLRNCVIFARLHADLVGED
jgi:hypothetical protein